MSEPTIGELDIHLINEGRHEQLWDALGAHVVAGWHRLPGLGARRPSRSRCAATSTAGTAASNPMAQVGTSGVWEAFVPGIGSGEGYKFHIRGADGEWRDKADPMAFCTEVPPATASRVFESRHEWTDDEWMADARPRPAPDQQPMSVYEVHLGSWRKHDERRAAAAMTSWPTSSRRTSPRWASPTSSCCR